MASAPLISSDAISLDRGENNAAVSSFLLAHFKLNFQTSVKHLINKAHPKCVFHEDCARQESTQAVSVHVRELRKVFPESSHEGTNERQFKDCGWLYLSAYHFQLSVYSISSQKGYTH